jgi:hypothetical protein
MNVDEQIFDSWSELAPSLFFQSFSRMFAPGVVASLRCSRLGNPPPIVRHGRKNKLRTQYRE